MINLSSGPSSSKLPSSGIDFVESGSRFSNQSTVAPGHEAVDLGTSDANDSSFTPPFLKTARHPVVCIFHLLFKVLALLMFLFGSFIFGGWKGDYVFSFVSTTIFLSMDFWTVKNITGRLLVGMRWWNSIKPDGSTEWIYEAHTDERVINLTDKSVFWTALYLWPLIWLVFLIVYSFRLQIEWVLLVVIGVILSGANLIGYWKCSKEAKKRVEQWTATGFRALVARFF